jgi:hypothetical protein
MAPYRILSLDGGGSWALLQVMALQELYTPNTRGREILKDFDLVAANSGGSITLGGLVADHTLEELLQNFFLDPSKRGLIFSPVPILDEMWLVNTLLRRFVGIGAKYKTMKKLRGLQRVLGSRAGGGAGDVRLSELPDLIPRKERQTHFLVYGHDYDRRRGRFFRSKLDSLAGSLPTPGSGDQHRGWWTLNWRKPSTHRLMRR